MLQKHMGILDKILKLAAIDFLHEKAREGRFKDLESDIAICDRCGRNYKEEKGAQCSKWGCEICPKCIRECKKCGKVFCPKHIKNHKCK